MKIRWWDVVPVTLAAVAVASCGGTAESMTAEDIVARCAEAMGGDLGIQNLRTLRFELSSPEREPTLWEIERPNLVRKERTGEMALVFDGSRVAYVVAPPNEDGSPAEPHLVDEAHWHHFEMDIALYVPAFFEYPATYVDTATVRGSPAHLLRVDLPMGGVVVYAVDAERFLPTRISLPDWGYDVYLGDYGAVEGFMYFHKVWSNPDGTDETVLESLELNPNLDAGRFEIPASIR